MTDIHPFQKELAISLIRINQYEAALHALGGKLHTPNEDTILNLLAYMHFRFNRVLEQTRQMINHRDILHPFRLHPAVLSAGNPHKRSCSTELINVLGEHEYLILSETIQAAQRKYRLHNFRDSILDFAVFYERFITHSIAKLENELKKIDHRLEYHRGELIVFWIREGNFPQTMQYLESLQDIDTNLHYRINPEEIPTAIHIITEQDLIPELHPVAQLLRPYLEINAQYFPYKPGKINSIRDVRNKLAHEGKYIDRPILEIELPYYKQLLTDCLAAMGLPNEDIYEQLNEFIEDYLRKN